MAVSHARLERQFMAFQLHAMGWTGLQVAAQLEVGYETALSDIKAERQRRAIEPSPRRDEEIGLLVAGIDQVLAANFAAIQIFMMDGDGENGGDRVDRSRNGSLQARHA